MKSRKFWRDQKYILPFNITWNVHPNKLNIKGIKCSQEKTKIEDNYKIEDSGVKLEI